MEHDAEEIWNATLTVVRDVINQGGAIPAQVAALGISNQRETVVLWDRRSGKPLHNAIVWQDRRTADMCKDLEASVPKDRAAPLRDACTARRTFSRAPAARRMQA